MLRALGLLPGFNLGEICRRFGHEAFSGVLSEVSGTHNQELPHFAHSLIRPGSGIDEEESSADENSNKGSALLSTRDGAWGGGRH
jgi:hypothetical protein